MIASPSSLSGLKPNSATLWQTSDRIRRSPQNPILTAGDIPYHATLIFNAGVCKFQGRYVMVFRNDFGDADTKTLEGKNLGLAFSTDGISWEVASTPINADPAHPLYGCYDPRLTVIEGRVYLCFARGHCIGGHKDDRGTCGGIAVTDDFENWEVLNVSAPDNRNMVLFPERIDGKLVRLERPFAGYLRPGEPYDIWMSKSPDGRYWGETDLLLTTADISWVNNKIGPAAPPVKTPQGWLTLFHGVDIDPGRKGWGWHGDWTKRYSAGVMLLDLQNPQKIIGICRQPVMVPDPGIPYECSGYRDHVIFPGGMILEDNGEVKIYYGSADTVECLATADVEDLLALCEPL